MREESKHGEKWPHLKTKVKRKGLKKKTAKAVLLILYVRSFFKFVLSINHEYIVQGMDPQRFSLPVCGPVLALFLYFRFVHFSDLVNNIGRAKNHVYWIPVDMV